MSVKEAQEFIALVGTDEALKAAVEAAPDRAARKALADGKGLHFTSEEMKEAASATPSDGELSDAALEGVAGGGGFSFGGFGIDVGGDW
jgi:predicted ribosomally synthesized peptide with nif11-like leader